MVGIGNAPPPRANGSGGLIDAARDAVDPREEERAQFGFGIGAVRRLRLSRSAAWAGT